MKNTITVLNKQIVNLSTQPCLCAILPHAKKHFAAISSEGLSI